MILDTSFAIDMLRGKRNAVEKIEELENRSETVFITSITVFELWQGLDSKTKEKLGKLENFVETFGLLAFDKESAKIGGVIYQDLLEKGARIDPEDTMIAGISIANGHAILTKDSDFSRIKNLRIETY